MELQRSLKCITRYNKFIPNLHEIRKARDTYVKKILKVASCMYCLNKDISIAFDAVLISLRCARY